MSDIYQIANLGLVDSRQRLEAVSLNAASASLTGYRRHMVAGRTFDSTLSGLDVLAASSVAASSLSVTPRAIPQQVDLQPGALSSTGRSLDLAIDADDSFFALTDGTQIWLTRAGEFRLNERGVLVGERDLPVVGTQGDLRLPGSDVTVSADGQITHRGVVVGALQLFRPIDRVSLQAAAGSLLLSPSGVEPVEPSEARVRSGTLEASNTDASTEMLSLMSLSRQFESLSRVLQSYDELLGRTIQKLGDL